MVGEVQRGERGEAVGWDGTTGSWWETHAGRLMEGGAGSRLVGGGVDCGRMCEGGRAGTIVQRFLRFSTIFEYFGWKRELYPILHEDHENQVLFCVSSMVT